MKLKSPYRSQKILFPWRYWSKGIEISISSSTGHVHQLNYPLKGVQKMSWMILSQWTNISWRPSWIPPGPPEFPLNLRCNVSAGDKKKYSGWSKFRLTILGIWIHWWTYEGSKLKITWKASFIENSSCGGHTECTQKNSRIEAEAKIEASGGDCMLASGNIVQDEPTV